MSCSSGSITPTTEDDLFLPEALEIVEEKKTTIGLDLEKEKKPKNFVLKVNNVSKLSEHYGNFFNQKKFSDVSFEVDGKTIVAHKFILAARG